MGEDFTGKWLDRRSGKEIFVRDVIMDGDTMCIMSSIGQIDPNVFQQYYVKVSEEEYSASNIKPQVSGQQLLNEINKGLDESERITTVTHTNNITLDTPIGNNGKPVTTQATQNKKETIKQTKQSINNETLIKKVFDKHTTEPLVDFNVNLDDWPIEQLKMLINVLDVSVDEISTYIIKNYLSEETLITEFSNYLKTSLGIDK
jgi:hypothetical protein